MNVPIDQVGHCLSECLAHNIHLQSYPGQFLENNPAPIAMVITVVFWGAEL